MTAFETTVLPERKGCADIQAREDGPMTSGTAVSLSGAPLTTTVRAHIRRPLLLGVKYVLFLIVFQLIELYTGANRQQLHKMGRRVSRSGADARRHLNAGYSNKRVPPN